MPSIVDLPDTLYIRLTEPLSTADEHLFPSSIDIVPRMSTILYDEMSWFSVHRTLDDALHGQNPMNESHWKLTVQTSWSMPDIWTQSLKDFIISSQAEDGDPRLVCRPFPLDTLPSGASYDYHDVDGLFQRLHIIADDDLEDGSAHVLPILVMGKVAAPNEEDASSAHNNRRSRYRLPANQSTFEAPCTTIWATLNPPPDTTLEAEATLQDLQNPIKMECSISLYTSCGRRR